MSANFKGLTQKQIDKRIKEGRGQGSGKDYKPFIYTHEVSSDGRVHRVLGYNSKRIHHLLSDLELAVFLLLDWQEDVIDVREQFPMIVEDTKHISIEVDLPHQKRNGVYQVLTTDFVVDTRDQQRPRFALQAKYAEDLTQTTTIERLELERRYWEQKGIPWYIITEKEIPKTVFNNIQWLYPAQQREVNNRDLQRYYLLFSSEFSQDPKRKIIESAQRVDMAYQLEMGEALYWLRNLLALRFFVFDLQIPYRALSAADLHDNAHEDGELVYASA